MTFQHSSKSTQDYLSTLSKSDGIKCQMGVKKKQIFVFQVIPSIIPLVPVKSDSLIVLREQLAACVSAAEGLNPKGPGANVTWSDVSRVRLRAAELTAHHWWMSAKAGVEECSFEDCVVIGC